MVLTGRRRTLAGKPFWETRGRSSPRRCTPAGPTTRPATPSSTSTAPAASSGTPGSRYNDLHAKVLGRPVNIYHGDDPSGQSAGPVAGPARAAAFRGVRAATARVHPGALAGLHARGSRSTRCGSGPRSGRRPRRSLKNGSSITACPWKVRRCKWVSRPTVPSTLNLRVRVPRLRFSQPCEAATAAHSAAVAPARSWLTVHYAEAATFNGFKASVIELVEPRT